MIVRTVRERVSAPISEVNETVVFPVQGGHQLYIPFIIYNIIKVHSLLFAY